MAHARLHVICGNCGCNDMFSYKIIEDFHDHGTHTRPGVVLTCGNCATNHDLENNAEDKTAKDFVSNIKANTLEQFADEFGCVTSQYAMQEANRIRNEKK